MKGDKNVKISNLQLFSLMAGFIIGSSIIIDPAGAAKEDSWLAFIFGWLAGFALMTIYVLIAKNNPNKTLIEILRYNFGKFIGTLISILYIFYFIHLAALVFRDFGEYNVTLVYQETPMVVIIALLAILVVYTVRGGLEVAGRISELLQPLLFVGIISLNFVLMTSHNWTAMFPVLKDGLGPVLKVGFSVMSFPFGELVVFLMIFPYVRKVNKTLKTSYLSVAIGGALVFITVVRNLIALGPDLISEITYPAHMASRLIPTINIEPLVSLNFFIGGGVKEAVLIFASVYGISQLCKIDNYKPLVLAITTFSVVLSIWLYSNSLQMFIWSFEIYPFYAIPFQIVIPTILLIVTIIRKKSVDNKLKEGKNSFS